MTAVRRPSRDIGCARSGTLARRPIHSRQRPNMPCPFSSPRPARASRPLTVTVQVIELPEQRADEMRERQLAVVARLLKRAASAPERAGTR